MEKLFDALEKAKKEKSDEVNSLIPSEHQLIEWLKGFQDVQTELNACVGCLEEGVSQINVLQGDDEKDEEVVVDVPQDIVTKVSILDNLFDDGCSVKLDLLTKENDC